MKKLIGMFIVFQCLSLYSLHSQGIKIPVKVVPVVSRDISSRIRAIGTVEAKDQIVFSTKVMAEIRLIAKEEGDFCTKDELLVEIDQAELKAKLMMMDAQKKEIAANVAALKAQNRGVTSNLNNAKKDLERQVALLQKGSTTQKNVDDIRTSHDALEAQKDMLTAQILSVEEKSAQISAGMKEVEALMAYTVMKAPFSGYITEKYSFQGELAKPGFPILKLLSLDTVKVELNVNETDIEKVSLGQDITITADSFPGTVFNSKVEKIVPEGNKLNRSFRIHGMIQNSEKTVLKPGMFVRGNVIVGLRRDSLVIPRDTLMQNDDQFYLFRVEQDQAVQVPVKTGYEEDDLIEIVEGVKLGDKVVISGKENLSNKSAVRVIE